MFITREKKEGCYEISGEKPEISEMEIRLNKKGIKFTKKVDKRDILLVQCKAEDLGGIYD
jgi:hypothetical protein